MEFYQIWLGRLTDCTHCTGQFTPKMKANAKPCLLSSLEWIDSGVVALWFHSIVWSLFPWNIMLRNDKFHGIHDGWLWWSRGVSLIAWLNLSSPEVRDLRVLGSHLNKSTWTELSSWILCPQTCIMELQPRLLCFNQISGPCYILSLISQGRIQEFWLGGEVKVAGRGPDQPTSKTYILKSFFLQIPLLLDKLNIDF